jgi:hypothetical protein
LSGALRRRRRAVVNIEYTDESQQVPPQMHRVFPREGACDARRLGGHNSFFVNPIQRDNELKRMIDFLRRMLASSFRQGC